MKLQLLLQHSIMNYLPYTKDYILKAKDYVLFTKDYLQKTQKITKP